MSNDYESFLRERWFATSQDAARAEAILEMILEVEGSKCQLPPYLKATVQRFLAGRQERRKAAQERIAALDLEREKERQASDYEKDIGAEIARRAKPQGGQG